MSKYFTRPIAGLLFPPAVSYSLPTCEIAAWKNASTGPETIVTKAPSIAQSSGYRSGLIYLALNLTSHIRSSALPHGPLLSESNVEKPFSSSCRDRNQFHFCWPMAWPDRKSQRCSGDGAQSGDDGVQRSDKAPSRKALTIFSSENCY